VYGVLKKNILKAEPNLASSEIKRKVKEKIMELYLNYIFLGNNAYGIETASRIYFGTSAQNLDVLQSAILASIPKSPSSVNPYGGRIRLMGKLTVTEGEDPIEMSGAIKQIVLEKIRNDLSQIDLSNKKDNNYFFNVLKGLISFQLSHEGRQFKVEYTQGRKDYSLERMFEQGFITDKQLKDAFIEGLDYQFKRTPTTIKAPHFVERITEYLKNNEFDGVTFDKDQLYRGGYTITTSLDYDVQQMSESSFQENIKTINGYGANNSAMVYLDSINGDVIAYV
jgi:membrane peptidoglycan carboxypeptidase